MALSAAVVAELVAAGLSGEALVSACERIEAAQPAGPSVVRTARQDRNARYYASQKRLKASESDASDGIKTVSDAGPAPHASATHAEPEPNKTTYPTTSEANASSVEPRRVAKPKSTDAQCVAELGKVLDPTHAVAVVEHRNRMRRPMTAHAAGLLAKSLAQAPDPNAAADLMIERGWQGWRPEWGQNSQAPPHRQAKNPRSLVEALHRQFPDEPPEQQIFPRLAFGG